MRRILAPSTEILVYRDLRVQRARVGDGHTPRRDIEGWFPFHLVSNPRSGGHRAFDNEGITWALGWDSETEGALAAAAALAELHPLMGDAPLTWV